MKKSKINFDIALDDNLIPEKIVWEATDAQSKADCKAFILSVWDDKQQAALRIDLWTKEMQIDEMKRFFYQTLLTLTDTFERATNETKICEDMREFAEYFGEKMNVLDKA